MRSFKCQLSSSQHEHMHFSVPHLLASVSMQNNALKRFLTCPGWWLRGRPLCRCPPWCRGSSHSWRSAWCSWVCTLWESRVLGSQSLIGGCRWWGPWHKDRTHERLWTEEHVMNRSVNNAEAYSMQAMELLAQESVSAIIMYTHCNWRTHSVGIPMKRMALRMKELKLQPAALMLASAPAPRFLWDRQQNRMASPIIICEHNTQQHSIFLQPFTT